MNTTIILLAIILLLYFMKVISFDLLRLQMELNRFVNWVFKTYLKIKDFFKRLFNKNHNASGI